MRGLRVVAVLVVVVLVAGACGGDDGADGGGAGEGSSSDGVSATLGIITTNIDTDTGDGFVDAVEGEELSVGDRVKTDDTGFAEVTYHDGSWMRVESEATLTIEDLVDGESGQVVSTSIDTGEAWSRVRELSEPEDEFVVDTPVGSAAVRGTAFAIECEGDTVCTFSVLEGEVVVTPDTGDAVTLGAGQSLAVTAGEELPAPTEPGVEALSAEPFIAENLELDEVKAAETDDGGDDQGGEGGGTDEDGTDEGASPLNGVYDVTAVITEAFGYDSGPIEENLGDTSGHSILIDCRWSSCFVDTGAIVLYAGLLVWRVEGNTLIGEGRGPTLGGDPSCAPQEDVVWMELTVDPSGALTGTAGTDREPGQVACAEGIRSGTRYVWELSGQRDG